MGWARDGADWTRLTKSAFGAFESQRSVHGRTCLPSSENATARPNSSGPRAFAAELDRLVV